MWILITAVILLQLAPFVFLAWGFRPLSNGAGLGGVTLTEWPAELEHPEYA